MPFVCGCRNLGEALRRINEGAAMIRTKGEAGSGDIVEAVRHLRQICGDMRALTVLSEDELATVVGHEIGHVAERHPLRALGRAVVVVTAFAALAGARVSLVVDLG